MQKQILSAPPGRHREQAAIPRKCVVMLHARNRRLHRKRHQNLARQSLVGRHWIVGGTGLKLPDAVQVHPVCAHHLRTWIFRQRIRGIHLLRIVGHQRRRLHLPGVDRSWGENCNWKKRGSDRANETWFHEWNRLHPARLAVMWHEKATTQRLSLPPTPTPEPVAIVGS